MTAWFASAVAVGWCPAISAPRHPTIPSAEPTHALFTFRRDDHTPDQLTTVLVDASRMADAPIHPYVFGNFIEHLGGVVYEGLWSQALLNPNLERIEAHDTAPPPWQLGGGACWLAEGYHSSRSVRLSPANAAAPTSSESSSVLSPESSTRNAALVPTLSQIVRLPLRRTRRYHVRLYARAPEGGKGQIAVELTDRGGTPLVQTTLRITAADWQPFRLELELPAQAVAAGHELRFTLRLRSGTAIEVDQIELSPADNIAGLDPDVLHRAQQWHPPLLRWPGGNFASGYHWRDGIGPHDQRPTRRNAAWGGIEPNHFGTAEFLDFARRVGATPQLTVNAGDGTPEEAAAWVRYCNAPANSPDGKLRAANGSPAPYGVKLWEVGNELYGGWQIGHTDPAGNAARYVYFRDAMLAADPTLHLIATGKADEFTPEGLQRDREWNRALLVAATAHGGRVPDYLSIHPLVPLPAYADHATYAEQYESALAQPTFLGATLLPTLDDLIHEVEGPQAPTRIAITEWGIIVGGPDWRQSPNHDSLSGALFNALTLNAMLRNSDIVALANMTALLHGGGIKRWNGVVYVDPQYYTQQLYTLAHPHTPVHTVTVGPGNDVLARGQLPAVADVPDVDTVAALTQDRRQLIVFAVNRHLSRVRPLRLEVNGFVAGSIAATLLTAPDVRSGNGWDHPNDVHPIPFVCPSWPAPAGHPWQVILPPHSLVVFTLSHP